jgi:hypothetical protein
MDFAITEEQRALQQRARRLAEDFATRAALHDRDATDPVENYKAHALFKTSPLERLFRDGAVAAIQFPPRDFCLASLGLLELDLDPRDVLPPLRHDRPDSGPVVR